MPDVNGHQASGQPARGTGDADAAPATTAAASGQDLRSRASAFALAIAVSVSCVGGFGLLVAVFLSLPIPDPMADAVESSMGVLSLGSLGVGAVIGMRTAGLSGWRTWLVVTVGGFCCMLALVVVSDVLIASFDEPLAGDLPFYAVLAGTIGWLLWHRRGPSSRLVSAVVVTATVAVAMLLLAVDDRSDDWLFIGIPAALLTALLIAWGLSVQRRDPDRRWPVIAVGLMAGLVAGLAMLQAIWAEGRWPDRRRFIDATAVAVGAVVTLVAVWSIYEPPFGLGPTIGAGRIERPAAGYALTLPDPWRRGHLGVREILGVGAAIGAEIDLMAVLGAGDAVALVALIEDGEEVAPGLMALGLWSGLQADPGFGDVVVEPASLASGETFRIDATSDDGQRLSIYPLSADGRTYRVLYFVAERPPEDHWLSIAETFEFLPVEEAVSSEEAEATSYPEAVLGALRKGPEPSGP